METKSLEFNVPFSGFASTTFINCFTSTYVFLENLGVTTSDYECKQMDGQSCDSCGNCSNGGITPIVAQERYFFLFDTMSGRSSLRCRFDGEPTEMQKLILGGTSFYDGETDYTVDFLFGFAGYNYRKLTDANEFKTAIIDSINADKPVIAEVNSGNGNFRVITGYDGDSLLCPDFTNAQNKPQNPPAYDEITALYIIGEKITPRYTLKDGLERIKKVMEYNINENLWGGYTEKMGLYTSDSLGRVGIDEKKVRMRRVADTMWHTFNCHNFAEVFRHREYEELKNPAFDEMCNIIGGPCYGYTHDLAWALIGLEECADWTKHAAGYFGEMIELTLYKIASNDQKVLEMINKMLAIIG